MAQPLDGLSMTYFKKSSSEHMFNNRRETFLISYFFQLITQIVLSQRGKEKMHRKKKQKTTGRKPGPR